MHLAIDWEIEQRLQVPVVLITCQASTMQGSWLLQRVVGATYEIS